MNRWIPLFLVAGVGAVLIGCTGTPSTPNSPAPSSSTAPPAGAVSFKTNVVPVLQQQCAACHTAGRGSAAAAVEMFSATGEAQHAKIAPAIAQMISAVRSGRMPKGKPAGSVPEAQIKTLENWQAAGTPNN